MRHSYLLIILLFVLFSSCIIEENTIETYMLENESSVKINVIPYKSGKADSTSIIDLDKGDKNTFEVISYRGKFNAPKYLVSYFAQVDSLLVIWDNAYMVLHLPNSDNYQGTIKTIDTTSDRCLGCVKNTIW